MADQEVIKHTKKIFSVWKGGHSFWHKLREFAIEIIIIVFAVSLSIYLHDNSEKKHQRHDTKEFLLGLKQDLQTDIGEMNNDKFSYEQSGHIFAYILSRKLHQPLNKDTINAYIDWMFNTTGLVPNNGRFEGFKSSGKIGNIENKELQDKIMDLYQEDIPNTIASTDFYTAKKQLLFTYVGETMKRLTDSTTNLQDVLASDRVFNIAITLTSVKEIIDRYDICIARMKEIIAMIDEEYGMK